MVNVRCGTSIEHLSSLSQNIPVAGREYFKDKLAEEATWGSHHPCHVHFANNPKECLTSTPLRSSVRVREDNILLPQQKKARENLAAWEFCKLCEPKINKLKGGYSAVANLIFQSRLKDIRVHVEDWNMTQREAMQLIKDFTVEHACDEVEFYMGMVVEELQTFKSLIQHLKNTFQSGETISELISNFYGQAHKKNDLKTHLWTNYKY